MLEDDDRDEYSAFYEMDDWAYAVTAVSKSDIENLRNNSEGHISVYKNFNYPRMGISDWGNVKHIQDTHPEFDGIRLDALGYYLARKAYDKEFHGSDFYEDK